MPWKLPSEFWDTWEKAGGISNEFPENIMFFSQNFRIHSGTISVPRCHPEASAPVPLVHLLCAACLHVFQQSYLCWSKVEMARRTLCFCLSVGLKRRLLSISSEGSCQGAPTKEARCWHSQTALSLSLARKLYMQIQICTHTCKRARF